MRQAFATIGLGSLCVPLLQGMAFSAPLPLAPSPLDSLDASKSYGMNREAGEAGGSF